MTVKLTRRALLKSAVAATGIGDVATRFPAAALAAPALQDRLPTPAVSRHSALVMAQVLNRTRFADLPPAAVKHAKMIVASTLASAASGALLGSARIIRDLAKEHGGRSEATIWFDGAKLPLTEASRVNAMLSDAAASDDSDLRNVAHTGTCVAATGLAIAERTGATGQDLLNAIVVGYEAAGRIGAALAASRGNGGGRNVHASAIVAFGGVVTAAKLLRLTDEQTAHAIGLTATTMGGLGIGTNSWAREYMAGNAALCAVNAALAASRGFTVNDDMLEAEAGYLATISGGKPDTQSLAREPGGEWDIVKYMAIKLVPGAHAFHSSVEAAVNASRQSGVGPEEVARILVSGAQSRTLGGNRVPKDMVEAIHSLPYFLASAVADKDFSWAHATPEKINRPVVARLIGLVETDPAPGSVRYEWTWGGTVTIVTKSGARYSSTVDAPRGSGPRGIEWNDVDAKFRAMMPDSGLPARRIEQVLNVIHDFEQLKKASLLTGMLS